MNREPATLISAITAAVTAILGLIVAFGLDVSDEQRNAILGVIGPAVGVIFLVGPLIRQFVYSPQSVEKISDQQYAAGTPPTEPQPAIPPPATVP